MSEYRAAKPFKAPHGGMVYDPEAMNDRRAQWGEDVIRLFIDLTGTDREDALGDLLADLRHWADRNKTVFDDVNDRSGRCYDEETSNPDEIDPTLAAMLKGD